MGGQSKACQEDQKQGHCYISVIRLLAAVIRTGITVAPINRIAGATRFRCYAYFFRHDRVASIHALFFFSFLSVVSWRLYNPLALRINAWNRRDLKNFIGFAEWVVS